MLAPTSCYGFDSGSLCSSSIERTEAICALNATIEVSSKRSYLKLGCFLFRSAGQSCRDPRREQARLSADSEGPWPEEYPRPWGGLVVFLTSPVVLLQKNFVG